MPRHRQDRDGRHLPALATASSSPADSISKLRADNVGTGIDACEAATNV